MGLEDDLYDLYISFFGGMAHLFRIPSGFLVEGVTSRWTSSTSTSRSSPSGSAPVALSLVWYVKGWKQRKNWKSRGDSLGEGSCFKMGYPYADCYKWSDLTWGPFFNDLINTCVSLGVFNSFKSKLWLPSYNCWRGSSCWFHAIFCWRGEGREVAVEGHG